MQRIALIDAPAVVGWSVWRKLDGAHARQGLGTALRALQVTPLEAVTYLLSGAMNEALLWIAQSDDSAQSLEDADRSLQKIISSLISST